MLCVIRVSHNIDNNVLVAPYLMVLAGNNEYQPNK